MSKFKLVQKDLEINGFSMSKLRNLENEAARMIQKAWKLRRLKQVENRTSRSVSIQTDRNPFLKMSDDFYAKLGSNRSLMTALHKSMFEAFTLYYLAAKVHNARQNTTP